MYAGSTTLMGERQTGQQALSSCYTVTRYNRWLRDVRGQHVLDGSAADGAAGVVQPVGAVTAAGDVVTGPEDGVALRRQTHLAADVVAHGGGGVSTVVLGSRRGCRSQGCTQGHGHVNTALVSVCHSGAANRGTDM